MRTAKAQISLHIRAVCSGPSLSANWIIGYYRMYEWRADSQMILFACARWCKSTKSARPMCNHLPQQHFCCWPLQDGHFCCSSSFFLRSVFVEILFLYAILCHSTPIWCFGRTVFCDWGLSLVSLYLFCQLTKITKITDLVWLSLLINSYETCSTSTNQLSPWPSRKHTYIILTPLNPTFIQ